MTERKRIERMTADVATGWARRDRQETGGRDQPQCFYGGAFPQSAQKASVRGLSPKARIERADTEVSLSPFVSFE